MKKIIVLLMFLSAQFCFSQGLGEERVAKLKSTVVKIVVNGQSSGTGFVVTEEGAVITCWHVIQQAFYKDSIDNRIKIKNIEAEFVSGRKIELIITDLSLKNNGKESYLYDHCILVPNKQSEVPYKFLKLGDFNKINEGDDIYTSGYPLGIKQLVITKGMVSTKWKQKFAFEENNVKDSIYREVAWLDLTLNRGNSGGPIIKKGVTSKLDEVVGIATFILNPYGKESQALSEFASSQAFDMKMGPYSLMAATNLMAKAIANNSIGISGCISINHLKEFTLKK